MNRKRSLFLFLAALLISVVTPLKITVASPTARIYVDPPVMGAAPGEFFNASIVIADVEGLYSYDLVLTWNTTILDVTSTPEEIEGTFLSRYPRAYPTASTARINNTAGWLYFTCTIKGDILAARASGNGTLATVEFLVKAVGASVLDLQEAFNLSYPPGQIARTKLRDYYLAPIPYTLEDGYFIYPTPKLFVDPPHILDPTLLVGKSFPINISVINVEALHEWSLHLSWDAALLNVTNVVEGPFLNSSGTTVFRNETNQEAGNVYLNCTLEGANGASGNGTLVTITFSVEALGSTTLGLYNTTLLAVNLAEIPHVIEVGYFNNKLHNVAIISAEVSPSEVKAGDSVSVTVVANNKGSMTETFDVKVWANYTLVGTQSVSNLAPGTNTTTLTFSWNTKDVAEGLYQIKAEATTVPEEVDITDNEYIAGTVKVTSAGLQFSPVLIIAVIAVAAAIGVVILFYARRKKPS